MRILIFEPDSHGHRLTAVRVLLEALLELRATSGCELQIDIACGVGARETPEFKAQLGPLRGEFEVLDVEAVAYGSRPSQIGREKAFALTRLLRERRHDHLYVPYGDGLVQTLALTRGGFSRRLKAEAVLMRGSFAYPQRSRLRAEASLIAARLAPFDRLHLIDPFAYRALRRRMIGASFRFRLMPDPTPATAGTDREDARRALRLKHGGRIVGCVGLMDERKGIPLLIAAFKAATLLPSDRLLLAGGCSEAVRELVRSSNDNRIDVIDRYLSEHELNMAVSAIDLMVTPYPGFVGSVSMCIRAAGASRKVLGDDEGWMGYVIPAFELGWTCNVNSSSVLAREIERRLPEASASDNAPARTPFVAYHQPSNVRAHWMALLRERLGLPADPRGIEWPDASFARAAE